MRWLGSERSLTYRELLSCRLHPTGLISTGVCGTGPIERRVRRRVPHRPGLAGQYTSEATARLCQAYGIRQSVGRTGVCWDNAAAESFLGTVHKELVNRADYHNRHQARLSIRWWIEARYNPRRLHSTIGHQPPNEWEDNYYHHTAV